MGVSAVLLACSMSGRAASEELINAGTIKEAPATESSSTTELTTDVSSEAPTTTSPDAVIVDSDKIELYLDRKMRAIGNASISQNNNCLLYTSHNLHQSTINYPLLAGNYWRCNARCKH